MAEFAANNTISSVTQLSPFFAIRGFYPCITFGLPRPLDQASPKSLQDQTFKGNKFVLKMKDIL
jgi:hypothetical protein